MRLRPFKMGGGAGFTLVEMMVAMTVMCLAVAGIVTPCLSGDHRS